jgi:hypothetical protein
MAQSGQRKALIDAARTAFKTPFGAVLKIAPEGETPFAVDGRVNPPKILDPLGEDMETHCAWRGAADVLARVFSGERALESAYVAGRLRISGDMSVMARLALDNAH